MYAMLNHRGKITHYDETEKMAHETVRAKENLKMNHGGPSQRHVSGAIPRTKAEGHGRY